MSDKNQITSDYLIDRRSLKSKLTFWRNIAVLLVVIFAVQFISKKMLKNNLGTDFIARIKIEGEILGDKNRDKAIKNLVSNPKVKSVIIHVDSPGGTSYSGESLHYLIKHLSSKKPTISVVKNYAASAAYMAVMPTEQIFARYTSLVGSIGAWVMVPDLSGLTKKLGVKVNMLKSGNLKAQPQPFETMTPKVKKHTQDNINDTLKIFLSMLKKDRKMTNEALREVSSGAVYLGQQALDLGLIDQIGAEEEALHYLQEKYTNLKNLKVRDVRIKKPRDKFSEILSVFDNVQQFAFQLKSQIASFFSSNIMLSR